MTRAACSSRVPTRQKLARSSLGGVATPACRWKHAFTIWLHADDDWPYWYELAMLNR